MEGNFQKSVKKGSVHQDMARKDLLHPCGQFFTGEEVVTVTSEDEGEKQWLSCELVPCGWGNERRQMF